MPGKEIQATESLPDAEDLAEARRIVLRTLDGQRAKVFLVGSRARRTHGPRSDIDIGVLPLEPLAADTLSGMREALEESTIPFHVDVIDLSTVDEAFRSSVLRGAISWND